MNRYDDAEERDPGIVEAAKSSRMVWIVAPDGMFQTLADLTGVDPLQLRALEPPVTDWGSRER